MYKDVSILLIEDNPGDRRLVSEVLKETEYASAQLLTASSLTEEKNLLAGNKAVVMVLLDLNLPDSEGLDTLREMRKRHDDSAIVILTGLDNNDIASEALREGAQSYITKDELDAPMLERNIRYSMERQQFISNLRRITSDLIDRNKDLEQFAYIVSHNLRAPVANIMGIEEMLKMDELGYNERDKLFTDLYKSVERLNQVVTDLNEILKVKKEINNLQETVEFQKVVEEIKASIPKVIEENKVVIETDFKVGTIYSLKSYLYSILYNLISNSIKYRRRNEAPLIKIKTEKENNKGIKLTFSDNGLGIDLKATKGSIFGLYKRFHRHVEGKGMGLYMVKTQVEALGGKIEVQSEPGIGTTFTIRLTNH